MHTAVESLEHYKRLHGNVKTIVDVGVEAVTYQLTKVFPEVHHYLFEPITGFNSMIESHYQNIQHTLVNVALSDIEKNEVLDMSNRFDLPNNDVTTFTTLDLYFKNKPEVWSFDTIVKIDVDGMEREIMQGGKDLLKSVGLLIVECTTTSLADIARIASEANLIVWDIVSPCYYRNQFHQCDILFINRNLHNANEEFRPWSKPFEMSEWLDWDKKDL